MFRRANTDWVTISVLGVEVNAFILIPKYVSATIDFPEEGGIYDFELKNIEYQGNDITDFLNDSELSDTIRKLIIDKWNSEN